MLYAQNKRKKAIFFVAFQRSVAFPLTLPKGTLLSGAIKPKKETILTVTKELCWLMSHLP
jgi:hypothetical protein